MAISEIDVTTMTTKELRKEFKGLARKLEPINTRRALIDKEICVRVNDDNIGQTIKRVFPEKEARMAVHKNLAEEFGES